MKRAGVGPFLRRMLVVTAGLTVSACGGGLFSSPPTAFDLTAPRDFPSSGRAPRGQLIVVEPTAVSILDSEKVMVRSASGEVTQLPDVQWSDRLPRLLQARMVQAFENANRLRSVGRPGERLAADYQLLTDVRAFQMSVSGENVAEVEIAAKIVSERSGRIVAARVFRVRVPVGAGGAGPAVAAIDQAFGRMVTEMVLWATALV